MALRMAHVIGDGIACGLVHGDGLPQRGAVVHVEDPCHHLSDDDRHAEQDAQTAVVEPEPACSPVEASAVARRTEVGARRARQVEQDERLQPVERSSLSRLDDVVEVAPRNHARTLAPEPAHDVVHVERRHRHSADRLGRKAQRVEAAEAGEKAPLAQRVEVDVLRRFWDAVLRRLLRLASLLVGRDALEETLLPSHLLHRSDRARRVLSVFFELRQPSRQVAHEANRLGWERHANESRHAEQPRLLPEAGLVETRDGVGEYVVLRLHARLSARHVDIRHELRTVL